MIKPLRANCQAYSQGNTDCQRKLHLVCPKSISHIIISQLSSTVTTPEFACVTMFYFHELLASILRCFGSVMKRDSLPQLQLGGNQRGVQGNKMSTAFVRSETRQLGVPESTPIRTGLGRGSLGPSQICRLLGWEFGQEGREKLEGNSS